MGEYFEDSLRDIPNDVLDQSKRIDAARDWATQQRAQFAQDWANEWRRRGEELLTNLAGGALTLLASSPVRPPSPQAFLPTTEGRREVAGRAWETMGDVGKATGAVTGAGLAETAQRLRPDIDVREGTPGGLAAETIAQLESERPRFVEQQREMLLRSGIPEEQAAEMAEEHASKAYDARLSELREMQAKGTPAFAVGAPRPEEFTGWEGAVKAGERYAEKNPVGEFAAEVAFPLQYGTTYKALGAVGALPAQAALGVAKKAGKGSKAAKPTRTAEKIQAERALLQQVGDLEIASVEARRAGNVEEAERLSGEAATLRERVYEAQGITGKAGADVWWMHGTKPDSPPPIEPPTERPTARMPEPEPKPQGIKTTTITPFGRVEEGAEAVQPFQEAADVPRPSIPRAETAVKAIPEGAKPITLTAEEEVQRLRLDKFPDWAQDAIRQAAENVGFAREQRRGVVPEAVSEQMADDLGRTVEDWIRQGKAGKAYSTEETRALRNAITAQAEAVNGITRQVAEARAAGQVTDTMLAQALTEGEKLQALVTVAEGARAEWGRAGLAWRAATRNVASPIENIERIYKKLGGRDNALKAVEEYNRLLEQGATPIQMAQFWSRVEKPPVGFKDWFELLRYNSMMSGPRTMEINLVGNALEVPWRLARDFGASTLRGRPQEMVPELAGVWVGLQRGVKPFMETLSKGITTEQALAGDLPRTLSGRVRNPVGKKVATALELTGRVNMAVDEISKSIAYSMGIGRQAAITATREGLKGQAWNARVAELIANPSTGMVKAAGDIAERMTFKGDMGALGNALGGIQKVPFLGNILLPFLRTVYHISARGVDRSPIGIIGTAIDVGRGAYKGGKVPQGAAPLGERLGDNIMGLMAGGALTWQALQGNISAAGPEDTEKRQMLQSTGWRPYSVKIGDSWVSYSNWGPLSIPFAMAASLAEAGLYAKEDADLASKALDTFSRFGKLSTEQTYLSGVGAVYRAINDPDRYGAQWLTSLMGSLVPYGSAINTMGQATDPYARRPEKVSDVGLGENVRQSLAARFPGLREGVPVAQDTMGRPAENIQTGAAAFQPFRISPVESDQTVDLLLEAGVDVPKAPKSVRNIPLKPEEQRRFEQIAGEQLRRRITSLQQSQSWAKASEKGRANLLSKMVQSAREQAANEILRGMGGAEIRQRKLEKAEK